MADIVIGLLNPYKIQAYDYGKYQIKKFVGSNNNNRFRSLKIIKNSYGTDDYIIGFHFLGEIGLMAEIPNSNEIDYDLFSKGEYVHRFLSKRKTYG